MRLKLQIPFILTILFSLLCILKNCEASLPHADVIPLVKGWADGIAKELHSLSMAMCRRNRVVQAYENTVVEKDDGRDVVNDIVETIRELLEKKISAVKRISKKAEELVLKHKHQIHTNSTYDYYNADLIKTTKMNETELHILNHVREENIFQWKCNELDAAGRKLLEAQHVDRKCSDLPYNERRVDFFRSLPLIYDDHFKDEVNVNYSVVKVVANVYEREHAVLNGALWSEALDEVFIQNYANDSTLKWQYFASPLGFMRHYPALKWSQESYNVTYDFRMRSWFSEAMTSPKDVFILLDTSGSMEGIKAKLSKQVINDILDTLNDNDFVNIYTFTNVTQPVVDCFNDTLVQANEENLRLLRESLATIKVDFISDIYVALSKAFEILERFRVEQQGAQCNQAIMLITESLDYDYNKTELFMKYNWKDQYYRPVRIFTYLIGNEKSDAKEMEWIACSNMGYYVNITEEEEIREKSLKYLTVMSRPINLNHSNADAHTPIWSYLYADLADRRLPNWYWQKLEGIRQRQVFLDFAKRLMVEQNAVFPENMENHILLQETHEYAKYEISIPLPFDYMTTISMPVFDKRKNVPALLGVAAVDLSISLIKSYIPNYRLGVNAYAFIITNNGYILMHPDLRTEFQNILKPTYNRVDMTEVEILDDGADARDFNPAIVELREKMVTQMQGDAKLDVIDDINNLKRILKYKRHYFYYKLPPFSIAVALPETYGFNNIIFKDHSREIDQAVIESLKRSKTWSVHPEWDYCKKCKDPSHATNTPEKNIMYQILRYKLPECECDVSLINSFISEAKVTEWFEEEVDTKLHEAFMVKTIFLATQSGLTRWKSPEPFLDVRTIDEWWYKRAVQENLENSDNFIYSVPFEIIGYENNTLIQVTSAVFSETDGLKAPAAVTGFRFNQQALYDLFQSYTNRTKFKCASFNVTCFILDNNGYVVLSDEEEFSGNLYTGHFIGDIRPDIMYHLVEDGVYSPTRMFDYQGICYYKPKEAKGYATKLKNLFVHLADVFYWIIKSIVYFLLLPFADAKKGKFYQSIKNDTLAWERLAINKTVPTPCDRELWMFTFGSKVNTTKIYDKAQKLRGCRWPYVIRHIAKSNLLLLAINTLCQVDTEYVFTKGPRPIEISYNLSLPCYIATKNSYKRTSYMSCFKEDKKEYKLNQNRKYCGGEGEINMY